MSDKTKYDEIVEKGVDFEKRRIYFGVTDGEDGEGFHWNSVEYVIRALHKLCDAATTPIELHMNSPGGNVYDMFRLYDEIQAAPCQIKFYGGGMIASAATWVMCGCDVRYLHKNTVVLVHDGSESVSGRHTDTQIDAKQSRRMQDRLYDIYATNSRMNKDFWIDVCQRDLYLTAEETIQLGLADKIIEPRKRGNLRKERIKSLSNKPDQKEIANTLKAVYSKIERPKAPKIAFSDYKEEVDETLSVD